MAEGKIPSTGTEKVDLNKPCVDCKKKKYTLCIRARKPHPLHPRDFGHANLALVETGPNGSQPPTKTYGNWPASYSPGAASTLKEDFKYDQQHGDYQYVRCKEVTEEQAEKLKQTAKQNGQEWYYSNNNCATWSSNQWREATGESLDVGKNNLLYDSPTTLGQSITKANGGQPTNFTGNWP